MGWITSDEENTYDVAPEPTPPPDAAPLLNRAEEIPPMTWHPVKDIDEQKRYTASDRMFYILRRAAGIPLILGGAWWIWHCAGGLSYAVTMMPTGVLFTL